MWQYAAASSVVKRGESIAARSVFWRLFRMQSFPPGARPHRPPPRKRTTRDPLRDDASTPLVPVEPERETAGRSRTKTFEQRAALGRPLVGRQKRPAVLGRQENGRGERREGQV